MDRSCAHRHFATDWLRCRRSQGPTLADLDLHVGPLALSQAVWQSPRLKDGPHAVGLIATEGWLVVDSMEVTR